jgi:8-amino-7-oxononanoate synthase
MSILERHAAALRRLSERGRLRQLMPAQGLDFASNDYLGLARSEELRLIAEEALARGVPIGSGGSRLLCGNHAEHEALEGAAAHHFGSAAALFFASGFQANLALFSTLPLQGDLVVYDALIHASAHDGLRLGRANARVFQHNDPDDAARKVKDWRQGGGTGRVWLAFESLYSMEGDRAPLADFIALANRLEAFLLIDEAHATGVAGPGGRGLSHAEQGRENVVTLHTCGKALGVSGALICGATPLCETLVTRARSFVYSTAPSPLVAAMVRGALGLLASDTTRLESHLALVAHAGTVARQHGLAVSGSHILPIVLGDEGRTMRVSAALQARGFDVRGIRPPTVPRGSARLRLSITLNTTAQQISAMFAALAAELVAHGDRVQS